MAGRRLSEEKPDHFVSFALLIHTPFPILRLRLVTHLPSVGEPSKVAKISTSGQCNPGSLGGEMRYVDAGDREAKGMWKKCNVTRCIF